MDPHERIFTILFSKTDEITWQNIIYGLVKSEEMDPWDINITVLSQKYIDMLRTLKEHDFRISGKVLLASAILLKMKSNRLVGEDLDELDRLLIGAEDEIDELNFEEHGSNLAAPEIPPLIPRTPQPRKRKVSIFDLVDALERALEVKKRRLTNSIPPLALEVPKVERDITEVIKDVYNRIRAFFLTNLDGTLTFTKLISSEKKEDKILTFIPLLYLSQQNKIEIMQEIPFGEIVIIFKEKSKT